MTRHPSVISDTPPSPPEGIPYEPDMSQVAKTRAALAVMKAKRDGLVVTPNPLAEVEREINEWFIEKGDES